MAKPFLKWVGGKSKLISQIEQYFPESIKDGSEQFVYVEPFLGGGSMLLHMLRNYENLKCAIAGDANEKLINCYQQVRDNPEGVISQLNSLIKEFSSLSESNKESFFREIRSHFNKKEWRDFPLDEASFFIFLNKTCFNGVYRENSKGEFNVPYGKPRSTAKILDENNIRKVSSLLSNKVTLVSGGFEHTLSQVSTQGCCRIFCYFDPPYRPLSDTSSFNGYVSGGFGDKEQRELSDLFRKINESGNYALLSNSDGSAVGDYFLENLYKGFKIEKIFAARSINSVGSGRGKISEILVTNKRNDY